MESPGSTDSASVDLAPLEPVGSAAVHVLGSGSDPVRQEVRFRSFPQTCALGASRVTNIMVPYSQHSYGTCTSNRLQNDRGSYLGLHIQQHVMQQGQTTGALLPQFLPSAD